MKHIFPNFSKLTLASKNIIEKLIINYPPFSDFTFTSLWTYNTNESVEYSILNDNLVIKFQDYITQEFFYSFIGSNKIVETTEILLKFSIKKGLDPKLKLIPHSVIESEPRLNRYFLITEDPDNHDYIISASNMANLPKKIYENKRYYVNRFGKKYPDHIVRELDLSDKNHQKQMIGLFERWINVSKHSAEDSQNELNAFKRLLNSIKSLKVGGMGIFIDKKLSAFTTFEIVHKGYGMAIFEKANNNFEDIYTKIAHLGAVNLHKKGVIHINFEQDLGIEGLRKAKTLWKPTHFLKKYIISPKK